ncbi:unnamed protein product [Absidia cylindrospora]
MFRDTLQMVLTSAGMIDESHDDSLDDHDSEMELFDSSDEPNYDDSLQGHDSEVELFSHRRRKP